MRGIKCYGTLSRILKSKQRAGAGRWLQLAKKRIYQTVTIRPAVTYGSELWILNEKSENQLAVWEREILRHIYGGIKVGNIWCRRTNQNLNEIYGDPGIV